MSSSIVSLEDFEKMECAIAVRAPGFNVVIEIRGEMDIEFVTAMLNRLRSRAKQLDKIDTHEAWNAKAKKPWRQRAEDMSKKYDSPRSSIAADKRRELICEFLKKNGEASSSLIKETLGLTNQTLHSDLRALRQEGFIRRISHGHYESTITQLRKPRKREALDIGEVPLKADDDELELEDGEDKKSDEDEEDEE